MTDDELNEIERRANAVVPFDFHATLPSCDHPERGHAPACHDCERAALQEEIANRKPTFATHGRQDAHALVAEVRRLRAILEGRTTPPTLREIAAHPGEWLVDGNVVGLYFYDDHDTSLRLRTSNTALGDSAARAWLAESASECHRWVAIDAEGRPCAWPVVSPAADAHPDR